MNGEKLPTGGLATQVFEKHFKQTLSADDYERAKKVFDDLGGLNERGLAIQFHMAAELGKLDDVLTYYERLMSPESYLVEVPDAITRAAEVRLFKDRVYEHIICDGDPMKLILGGDLPEIPAEFEMMGQVSNPYN